MTYTINPAQKSRLKLNEQDETAAILQNIRVLLATKQGSVPLYRQFGLLQQFLDKPLAVAKPLLYLEVKEAIEEWEPRAEVVDVDLVMDEERPGRLLPVVEVRIKDEW